MTKSIAIITLLFCSCLSMQREVSIYDILKKYPEKEYIIGVAKTEDEARSELAKVFKIDIKSYTEANSILLQLSNKAIIDKKISSNIEVSSDVKQLIGITIDIYYIKGQRYVCAKMNKKEGLAVYAKLLNQNEQTIDMLLKQASKEKDKLTKYSFIKSAYDIASLSEAYVNILLIMDPANKVQAKSKDAIKVMLIEQANNIVFNIDVNINSNIFADNKRLASIFGQIMTNEKFSLGKNYDYHLIIDYSLKSVSFSDSQYKFVNYDMKTVLYNRRRDVIKRFGMNDRVGHASLNGAIEIALLETKEVILTSWFEDFNKCLNSLI